MENIFKDFAKLSENQSVDEWIKQNKEELFKLKRETNEKWKTIAEHLTDHLETKDRIRPSILTEKLTLHYFLASPQPKKKFDY